MARVVPANRMLPGLALIGLLALGGGCGGDPNSQPAAPASTPEQHAAERDARVKAYGKATIPTGKAQSSVDPERAARQKAMGGR